MFYHCNFSSYAFWASSIYCEASERISLLPHILAAASVALVLSADKKLLLWQFFTLEGCSVGKPHSIARLHCCDIFVSSWCPLGIWLPSDWMIATSAELKDCVKMHFLHPGKRAPNNNSASGPESAAGGTGVGSTPLRHHWHLYFYLRRSLQV